MKKYIPGFPVLVIVGVLTVGVSSIALAGNTPDTSSSVKTENKSVAKDSVKDNSEGLRPSLIVDQSGVVKFSGARLVSTSASGATMTVMGLPLTFVTNSSTQIVGITSLSNAVSGDVFSGRGEINQSTGVITATSIVNESRRNIMIADLEKQINSLLEQLRQLQAEFKTLR